MNRMPARLYPLALVALLAACAQQPERTSAGPELASRASLKCPAGQTMICEARSIGRIRHGTFARANDRCACVRQDLPALKTPVIPTPR